MYSRIALYILFTLIWNEISIIRKAKSASNGGMMNTGENSAIKNNMISNKMHTQIKPMRNTFTDFTKENRTVCVAGQIAISGTAEFTKKLSSFSGFSNIMVSPSRFTVYV